ncbi:hypothetical protein SAMN05660653_02355 [Desulfonatronum thiosulfatophilum]|uniref:Uncharacterized protein n=1 Tax=Desulfonatronum thiosulfatophilum TaxID=617002 RepID=A0A1G6DS04_9BACT|nr:hypothetical protein [Desulfonatronum thiosulfatophilum]SDB47929.1 hypothetical protein SAMN05660653_02355 [Desulfonatronum thiosulfatophilum]
MKNEPPASLKAQDAKKRFFGFHWKNSEAKRLHAYCDILSPVRERHLFESSLSLLSKNVPLATFAP